MYTVIEIQNIIEVEIKKLNFNKDPKELYEPIQYVMNIGGKRIRPILTLLACNLFSEDLEKAFKPAIGIEMFHNFTLLHDDIMDNAPLRRNKQTVHTKWNNNVAILSGDAMMIKSFEYFYDCSPLILKEILYLFNEKALQVCEGQQYDMNFENHNKVFVDEYIKMIELKTSVLIAGSLKIGALIGGSDNSNAQLLYDFGKYLGIAFQLQDDYLDVYGDVKIFGKKIGGDIVSNKKTFLLITALNLAKGQLYNDLIDLLKKENIAPEIKISEITIIYNMLNIKQLILNKINEYFDLAGKCIDNVGIEEAKKIIIKDFVLHLKFRKN